MKVSRYLQKSSVVCLGIGLCLGGVTGWILGAASDEKKAVGTEGQTAGARSENSLHGRNGAIQKGPIAKTNAGAKPLPKASVSGAELRLEATKILKMPNERARLAAYRDLLTRVSPAELPEMLAMIRESDLRGTDNAKEWETLWYHWGQAAPQAGADFIAEKDWTGWNQFASETAKNQLMLSWSKNSPTDALDYLEKDRDIAGANGPSKDYYADRGMIHATMKGMSEVDPEGAAEWLFKTALGEGGEYREVINAIRRRDGFEGLTDWYAKVKTEKAPRRELDGFAKVITDAIADRDTKAAQTFISESTSEEWQRESESVAGVAQRLAQQDTEEALDWAAGMENREAVERVLGGMMQSDLVGVAEWLSENQDSPAYENSARQLSYRLRASDPEAAALWLKSAEEAANGGEE
jgi:hypothetical protein